MKEAAVSVPDSDESDADENRDEQDDDEDTLQVEEEEDEDDQPKRGPKASRSAFTHACIGFRFYSCYLLVLGGDMQRSRRNTQTTDKR